jgi:hypothetical protein
MALQLFVGPWSLLQFDNLFYTDGSTLDLGSASLKDAAYTQDNTHTGMHALNGIRTHDPIVRTGENTSCTPVAK